MADMLQMTIHVNRLCHVKCKWPQLYVMMMKNVFLLFVYSIGCVYQSVLKGSGETVGVVKGATPPVRAALGVAVTSARPVNLVIT